MVSRDNVMVAVYEDHRAVVFMVGQEGQLQFVKEIEFLKGCEPE